MRVVLAEEIGEPSHKIEEIVDRYQPITPEVSPKLEKALGIPASFWNNLQKKNNTRGERMIDVWLGWIAAIIVIAGACYNIYLLFKRFKRRK